MSDPSFFLTGDLDLRRADQLEAGLLAHVASTPGDPVVIVNAAKIKVTGKKLADKMYVRHSGYPGGIRSESRSGASTASVAPCWPPAGC